jgi:hypothetical protein
MKPDKSITITDASIKQVAIEVKVIKIDNKQMTLAVFRQLPERPIIHEGTGELTGLPWGRVNYHIGCEEQNLHFHVVWQKENELCRSLVSLPWENSVSGRWDKLNDLIHKTAKGFLFTQILEGWKPDSSELPDRYALTFQRWEIKVWLDGYQEKSPWGIRADGTPYLSDRKLREYLQRQQLPESSSGIKPLLLSHLEEQEHLKYTWQQTYAELEALDQLFIAV